MDGRQTLLRKLLIATLACTSITPSLVADDFIRPPTKSKQNAPKPDQAIRQPARTPAKQAPAETEPNLQSAMSASPAKASPSNSSTDALELDAPQVPRDAARVTPPTSGSAESRSRITATFASRGSTNATQAQPASTRTGTGTESSPLNWQPRGSTVPNSNTATKAVPSLDAQPTVFGGQAPASTQVSTQSRSSDVRLVPEPTTVAPVDEEKLARQQLAERISKQLTSDSTATGTSTSPIEPGAGWQAIGEELKAHVAKCEELLSRKAHLSAIAEADQGILRLARALDLRENRPVSEPAWLAAQQSFRESQDFTRVDRLANDSQMLAQLIQSHQTPVLRGANVDELTPLAAAQHYRAHAEACLVATAQGHPWFGELYYCMGRALQAQAEGSSTAKSEARLLQAVSYFRAAHSIDPANATNSNQLSYVLLRLDRSNEAMQQLQQTVTLPNCPIEAYQNLAQASVRLGDKATEQWAVDRYTTLKMQGVEPSGPVNTLLQVTPEQFMAMSPRTVGPNQPPVGVPATMPAGITPNMQPASPPPVGGQDRTANNSIFGIFR